jgi:hypothetical protein
MYLTATLYAYEVLSMAATRPLKLCTIIENKLGSFVLLCLYPQHNTVNVKTCPENDEFKLISRTWLVIKCTVTINTVRHLTRLTSPYDSVSWIITYKRRMISAEMFHEGGCNIHHYRL